MSRQGRILVVDDDQLFSTSVVDYLSLDGLSVEAVHTCADAERRVVESRWDLVLLDNQLPDGTGLELAHRLIGAQRLAVILVTAHADLGDAVEALQGGIHDYLIKPVDLTQLRFAALRSLQAAQLERVAGLEERRRARDEKGGAGLHSENPEVRAVFELARRAAATSSPVLIQGETGTGKTLLARAMHRLSDVAEGPFVAVNCAAIPDNLVEAELFGTMEGAYTGAKSRPGLFELASGGTLLLDEIGELPLSAQATLLSAIEDRRVRRVGSQRETPVEVRLIAATHVSLCEAVQEETFRADLLYRLDVLSFELPPLRRRPEDLRSLVDRLLHQLAPSRRLTLADGELERLAAYRWPSNIRELRNVLERSLLLSPTDRLTPSHFVPQGGVAGPSLAPPATFTPCPLATVEREHIERTLAHFDGHREQSAEALGISTATLRRRLAAYRKG